MSVLTKDQVKIFGPREIADGSLVKAEVHFDDRCGNGHNTFSITGEMRNSRYGGATSGCIHKEISEAFPELAPFIKWHLCSTDGPLHYIANTVYFAKQGNLEFARSSAIWPDADIWQLCDKEQLLSRLPQLLADFRRDVESLGFTY
jgi:hypothetical protein